VEGGPGSLVRRRASGILLHVSSLPSEFGIGDLGPEAYRWVDFLAGAGQSIWQVLPLNPTTAEGHNSPYQSASAFAGNPLFISPSLLGEAGLLTEGDLRRFKAPGGETIDYGAAYTLKRELLDLTYGRFVSGAQTGAYDEFCARNASWLNDFALFMAIARSHPGRGPHELPAPLRDRTPEGLAEIRREEREEVERQKFFQYLFSRQWHELKRYANGRGVQIVGDLPFYTGGGSADVWANPSLFKLDESKRPRFVAGVPPDAFSATGQLWGNPVYDWDRHMKTGYGWWIARMRRNLELFDIVRIDHFRGFAASWEIPAGDETAAGGGWADGPGDAFFRALLRHWPFPPIIAEDLGMITADVRELMRRYQFPGMKVLLFAFDGDSANPYLPHNHETNAVLYTGTHDNNTARGWFEDEAGPDQKRRLAEYVGAEPAGGEVWWELIRLAMMSVCGLAVIPMQDVLGLGSAARMNRPAVATGNWEWRLRRDQATDDIAVRLSRLAETYGRA
jgi:4-alpha-glucanotransferase